MTSSKTAGLVLCFMLCLLICLPVQSAGASALGVPSKPSTRMPGVGTDNGRSTGVLPIWWVEASSVREDSKFRDEQGNPFIYPVEYICDGKPDTCWTPALLRKEVGNGIGEYVDFYFEYAAEVVDISVLNGYAKNKEVFFANSRPKQLEISFLYRGKSYFTDEIYADLQDGFKEYQSFGVLDRKDVEAVRVRVTDVYGGSRFFGDICISEVVFTGAWM